MDQSVSLITPAFRVDFIDAAQGIDVPPELFETGISFFYRRTINDRLSTMAILRPSVRSDFTTSDNAFRLFWPRTVDVGLRTGRAFPFIRSCLPRSR